MTIMRARWALLLIIITGYVLTAERLYTVAAQYLLWSLGVRPRIQTSGVVLPGGVKQSEPIMFHGQKLPAILPG